jgi:distribution and morphology protein 31
MKPSHLRQRIWSQPLPFKRPCLISRPTYPEASRCAFSQSRQLLARRPQLRIRNDREFASHDILFPKSSFLVRSTSLGTIPRLNNATKTLYSVRTSHRPVSFLAWQAWRSGVYLRSQRGQEHGRRNKSSTSKSGTDHELVNNDNQSTRAPPAAKKEGARQEPSPSSNKYLHLSHLPKMPHRPTKEELLAAATGFWSRLKVRFKWFSIRSVRPWNVDDWSAFVSWFVLGNIVWILVGTTTFFSLVILSINTVVAQGML